MTEKNTNDLIFEQAKALAEKKAFQNRIYRDEPLLVTAASLLRDDDDAPDGYKELIRLSNDPSFGFADARRFYEQAKLMADFEEDENYLFRGRFDKPRPAFSNMTVNELRGYFSWRTRLRHGRMEKAPFGFVILYISEIINLIGVDNALQGFDKLSEFLLEYSKYDAYLYQQGLTWAKNFAIYYNIPPEKYNRLASALKPDCIPVVLSDALCVLVDYRNTGKDELLQAIFSLSTYNITKSKWVKNYPDEVTDVVCAVYDALFTHYADAKKDFFRQLFPFMREISYQMRFSHLFYQKEPHPDCIYRLSPLEIFECRNGLWNCTGMESLSTEFRSQELGMLLKTIDWYARTQHGLVPPIQKPPVNAVWEKTVASVFKSYLEEKEKQEKEKQLRAVKIDKSLLASIRRDSDETRDKLLTDDEIKEDGAEKKVISPLPDITTETAVIGDTENAENPDDNCGAPPAPFKTIIGDSGYKEIVHTHESVFAPDEIEFVSLILSHGNLRAFAKAHATFVSAYADKINAVALDTIGDTVIECDGDTAEITDYYIDELKEMCGL